MHFVGICNEEHFNEEYVHDFISQLSVVIAKIFKSK